MKKPKLSPEESALFRQSCNNIQPLKQDKLHFPYKTSPASIAPSINRSVTPTFYPDELHECAAEDELFFARGGLQHKTLKQLRQGQIKIEARLDLHHFKSHEAIEACQQFLENAQARGLKWVLVIHGKGHFSKDGKAILKSLLNEWLREQTTVLAFASSQAKHGGRGAVYVLLKRGNYA